MYFPYSPLVVVEASFAEAVRPRDVAAVDLQPRLGRRVGRVPDDPRRRGPSMHRDGIAAYPRDGRRGERPSGVHRGIPGDLQPRGSPLVRRAVHGHQRPQLHPRARHRRGRLPGAGEVAGRRHDLAGRHLRRRGGGAARRRGGRSGSRRRPARLRRPRRDRPRGACPARRPGRDRHQDRRDQRPRRVRDLGAGGRPRSTATASARSWSPAADTPRAASSTSWWPTRTTRAGWCRSPRRASTRSPSAAASGPCAGSTTGSHRPRSSASARLRRTTATTDRSSSSWSGTAWSSAPSRSTTARDRHARARAELPPAAEQMSKGEPVIETVHV